nr:lipoprotein [Bowmanella dokdonensis]
MTAALLLLFLAGCGQKGPLNLPEQPSTNQTKSGQPAEAEQPLKPQEQN